MWPEMHCLPSNVSQVVCDEVLLLDDRLVHLLLPHLLLRLLSSTSSANETQVGKPLHHHCSSRLKRDWIGLFEKKTSGASDCSKTDFYEDILCCIYLLVLFSWDKKCLPK